MLKLPQVDKGTKRPLTRIERVQKIVAGVALVVGTLMSTGAPTVAQASIAPRLEQPEPAATGALLLTVPQTTLVRVAYHMSHSSHASHGSHSSHASSRY